TITLTTGKGDINIYDATVSGASGVTGIFDTETQTTAAIPGDGTHTRAEIAIGATYAGSYFDQWLALHEMGHALGLSHTGSNQYDANYDVYKTVMSYNIPGDANATVSVDHWAVTPMAYDIAALQQIYGSFSYHSEN